MKMPRKNCWTWAEERPQSRKHRIFFWSVLVIFCFTLALWILPRTVDGFAEWYATAIYPILVKTVGRLFGWIPFSVTELLLFAAIILVPIRLIIWIRKMRRNKNDRTALLFKMTSRLLAAVLCVAFLFTANCGVNYYRKEFSVYSGLTVSKSTTKRLSQLCVLLTDRLIQAAQAVECDENGRSLPEKDVHRHAVEAMNRLGEIYPVLQGYYPQPKAVLLSRGMSYLNITGIYSPFTIEANYNADPVAYTIPTTVCHELSHLRGFMREDEANFIGYLACVFSDSAQFVYSGEMMAYIYATNALWSAGEKELYKTLMAQLPAVCRKDINANNAYWKEFETPVAQISTQINNSYLQSNGQVDGVKSYGRMVDLLLAYYIPNEYQ